MGIVQYLIVRSDLGEKYGPGVLVTQGAHAALAPISNKLRSHTFGESLDEMLDAETMDWLNGRFTKIVLEVPNEAALEELAKLLGREGVEHSAIRESSLKGELTAIGLKPYEKDTVAPYLRDLPLLGSKKHGKKPMTASVNNLPVNPERFTYSTLQLSPGPQRPGDKLHDRYVWVVDFAHFVGHFGVSYETSRQFYEANGMATGHDSMNGGPIPPIDHIMTNDPRLIRYVLDEFGEDLIGSLIPESRKTPKFSVTSVDGLLYAAPNVYICGSCVKL